MRFARPIEQLIPRPRIPVTWRTALPLLLFLIVFCSFVLVVQWRGLVHFTFPAAFALLAVTPWIWWMHHVGGAGLGRARGVTALLVRLLVAGTFIALLADRPGEKVRMPEGDVTSAIVTRAQRVHLNLSGFTRQRLSRPVRAIGQALHTGQATSTRSAVTTAPNFLQRCLPYPDASKREISLQGWLVCNGAGVSRAIVPGTV